MQQSSSTPQQGLKTGVFVDVANIILNGGYGMRYDILRRFASRNNAQLLRLNAYVSFDTMRATSDLEYRIGQKRFHAALRDLGYKVIIKEVRWYKDSSGNQVGKSNVDMDLAVDALAQSENLDRVILVTGDGDFVQVIRALQNKGCRVEAVAFSNASGALRRETDSFVSGYLIPHLLPSKWQQNNSEWGDVGSYVRGVCISYEPTKNYGFFRYLNIVEGDLWRIDYRDERTPYSTIFFHDSEIIETDVDLNKMTHRRYVMEFEIAAGQEEDQVKAVNIHLIPAAF